MRPWRISTLIIAAAIASATVGAVILGRHASAKINAVADVLNRVGGLDKNVGLRASLRNTGNNLASPVRVKPVMVARLHRREQIAHARRDIPDALDYVRWLLPAATSGDTEAQFAIADEIQSCYWLEHSEQRGKTWRQRLQDPAWYPKGRDRIQRQLARCDLLNAASEEEVGDYGKWMDQAVAGGDGRALLMRAGLTDDHNVDEQLADFHAAIATGDPQVLRNIVVSYAYMSDGYSWKAQSPDNRLAQMDLLNASLDLAECELGDSCSLQERQVGCADEWAPIDCSYASDLRNYYELHLSAEDFTRVSERAHALVDKFPSGNYDWPEARAYEETLKNPPKEDG